MLYGPVWRELAELWREAPRHCGSATWQRGPRHVAPATCGWARPYAMWTFTGSPFFKATWFDPVAMIPHQSRSPPAGCFSRPPLSSVGFSQSPRIRPLLAAYVFFLQSPHTVAFGSVRSSRTRLLLRFSWQLSPFCSLFQHSLSPSSYSRLPLGSSP